MNYEEVKLFGIKVSNQFWESDNFYSAYKEQFCIKLHHSLRRMLEAYLRDEIDFELYWTISCWHDQNIGERISSLIAPVIVEFKNLIKDIIYNSFEEATDIYNWGDGTLKTLIDQLMETELIHVLIRDFSTRLKILKNNGNILEYYNDKYFHENIDEENETAEQFYERLKQDNFEEEFFETHFYVELDEDITFDELLDLYQYLYN